MRHHASRASAARARGRQVAVRVGLVALLEERNYVLARSIRRACREQPAAADGGGEPPAVVAVLGMAHLNGVRQLLSQSRPI
eukprot:6257978-Prymnesium_polylepis.1